MIYYGPTNWSFRRQIPYANCFISIIYYEAFLYFFWNQFFKKKIRWHLVKSALLQGMFCKGLVKICKRYMEVNHFLVLICHLERYFLVGWFFNVDNSTRRQCKFTKFTRSTLWGEFAWVGAIIFVGNFMVRGQFSGGNCMGGQFSSGAIILWGNCLGGNPQRGNYPGDNFPRGQLSWNLFSHQHLSCSTKAQLKI